MPDPYTSLPAPVSVAKPKPSQPSPEGDQQTEFNLWAAGYETPPVRAACYPYKPVPGDGA